MSARPHGYARYKLDGCRCYTCGRSRSQYDENRVKALTAGTWQPYVDAEPVRIHIRHLQSCDMGLRAIAAAAGVDRKRLQAVLNGRPERGTGPQPRVRPQFADAVLAVEPTLDNLGGATVIDATGTRRRLQALVAMGWPQQYLGAAIDVTPNNFSTLIAAPRVIVRTARAVRDLYDAYWRADPLAHGATQAGVTRARRRATSMGWPPVGAWDDDTIDDPAAHPDWTRQCGTPQGYYTHYRLGITPACAPCRHAYNARKRERQLRKEVAA